MGNTGKQNSSIYLIGAVTTIIVLCGIVIDIIVGSITGGDISALPQTAAERFAQFHSNWLLGLYNLDLLNIINQVFLIPAILAIYMAHKNDDNGLALLSFILFLVGTTVFITGNTALTMFDLSQKYFSASSTEQKNLIAAAGEAMLAQGAHGSFGVFIGFALPTFANLLVSVVMLQGKVFSRTIAYFGFAGNILMLLYVILITFFPATEKVALIIAMPGGLLVTTWMILFMIRLFKLSTQKK
ncbi:MAG TPA: hypothetical protein DER09_09600 [Prolixibacteraceae bacterium]|nr:hypothetical protein [Prolixibacteraceae bacterium]